MDYKDMDLIDEHWNWKEYFSLKLRTQSEKRKILETTTFF